MKILVTPTSFAKNTESAAFQKLKAFADEIVVNPYGRPLESGEVLELLSGVDGYIAGLDFITAEVLEKAPSSLKAISRYGVGYDRVDIPAATKRGIIVTNTPGANTNAVADLAFGLMLALARDLVSLDRKVKEGGWPVQRGVELYGKTLGILGLGAIGRAVARRASGFDMKILAYDPFLTQAQADAVGATLVELDEIYRQSDFISLHMPVTEQTKNMVDARAISLMKPHAIIVNTARGGLIEETAVYEALREKRLGGLGLDAFVQEPPAGNPLLTLDNVVATPHTGARTKEAVDCMADMSVQNLIEALTTGTCRYQVNR